jgi:hypothetical protein
MYIPDSWVLVKINDSDHRVLAGWSGGYLDGNSWRLNSGVVRVERVPGAGYDVHGNSGSVYRCFFGTYALRMSMAPTAAALEKFGGVVLEESDAIAYLESLLSA